VVSNAASSFPGATIVHGDDLPRQPSAVGQLANRVVAMGWHFLSWNYLLQKRRDAQELYDASREPVCLFVGAESC
jgi:hypothetical protein